MSKAVISINLLLMMTLIVSVSSFGGSEDRFIKKYAMMKIYESCFGPEVVRQIRKEMKAACAKCAALETPAQAPPSSRPPPPPIQPVKVEPNAESNDALYPGAQMQPNFDAEKLHQAILAYRPNSPSFFRPYQLPQNVAPFYNQPFVNPGYQGPMFYPGFQQQPAGMNQFSPYGLPPLLGQSFYNNRMSRDMDIKSQLETLTSRMSGKVRNVTCVMQELGYLDDNLEPNFEKINERISNLPVSEELRRDMQDGVTFCQQFSQCVPEVKKDKSPLSRELIRPMFFFKCYKHKKLEACIMKDVREKYAGVTDEELDGDVELRRTGKSTNLPAADGEIDELASSMYEFLYGSDSNIEIESII